MHLQTILIRNRRMIATGAVLGAFFPELAIVTAQLLQWGGQ